MLYDDDPMPSDPEERHMWKLRNFGRNYGTFGPLPNMGYKHFDSTSPHTHDAFKSSWWDVMNEAVNEGWAPKDNTHDAFYLTLEEIADMLRGTRAEKTPLEKSGLEILSHGEAERIRNDKAYKIMIRSTIAVNLINKDNA